jgi:two-component system, cell cycle response regulator
MPYSDAACGQQTTRRTGRLLQRLEMSTPHKIVLIGFSSFERATFESFFRLAARRPPGYLLVTEPAEANLAVVNADDAATLRNVTSSKPCAHVMLIGSSDGGTGWPAQSRPLNLMKVLTTVEQLLNGQRASAAAVQAAPKTATAAPAFAAPLRPAFSPAPVAAPRAIPSAAAMPAATAPVVRPSAPSPLSNGLPRSVVAPVPAASPTGFATTSIMAPAPARPAAPAARSAVRLGMSDASNREDSPLVGGQSRPMNIDEEANVDHILVVDDSDIALKFMRNRLTRFGFRTDLVNSGEEALGRLNVRPYKFVFLDVMMEGLDGYQTCRAIKQRKYSEGKPPVVVMLTSRGGTIDKIRGTLAGCDAYLTKPLNERDLIAVLAKHDRTVARGFQETNFGASAKSGFGAVPSR